MSSRLIRRKTANDRWGDIMARAGPYHRACGGLGLAASAATENPWGCGGASVSTARVACDASGLGRYDGCHRLLFKWPIIFWTPRDVQSPRPPTTALSKKLHSLPLSIRRIIQP